jgi:hypothetical protein
MTLQGYLAKARTAVSAMETSGEASPEREKSETSERSRRYQPGGRYEVRGLLMGVIHRSTRDLHRWRIEAGLPRSALMTIQGELVLVADVRLAMKTGFIDVTAIPKSAPTTRIQVFSNDPPLAADALPPPPHSPQCRCCGAWMSVVAISDVCGRCQREHQR